MKDATSKDIESEVKYRMGVLMWCAGGKLRVDKNGCLAHMNACIQLNPSNAKTCTFIGHLYCCEMQSKDESAELAQEAVQCYRAALNASPMDIEAGIALSQLFFDLNDVQSACELWNEIKSRCRLAH